MLDGFPSTTADRDYGSLRSQGRRRRERAYRSLRVELPQLLSDDHTLRESRKRSTGVDDPRASKRCSSTPLHWKPHFSRMLREAGLVTRAPAVRCSISNSSKVKSITARVASVPKPW